MQRREPPIIDPVATPTWSATLAGVTNGDDIARAVVILKGGATLVGGELSTSPTAAAICLSRYRGGFREWTKTFQNPAGAYVEATALVLSPDGRWAYQVAGSGSKLVVLKRSSTSGALAWSRLYSVPGYRGNGCVAAGVDARGNLIALCKSTTATAMDWAVVSWTPAGGRRWTLVLPSKGTNTWPWDLAVAPDGSSYATGLWSTASGTEQSITMRFSAAGRLLWSKKYAGPESLGADTYAIALRPGGGAYVAGYATRASTGKDGLVLGYKASGARTVFSVDPYRAAPDTQELFRDVAVTAAGNVIVGGDSSPPWPADTQPYVAMYGRDGVKRWGYTAVADGDETFSLVGADPFGGWFVAGSHYVSAFSTGVHVLRGSEVENAGNWLGTWLPATGALAEPIAMAVRDTSVCVIGACRTSGNDYDQFVVDYTY